MIHVILKCMYAGSLPCSDACCVYVGYHPPCRVEMLSVFALTRTVSAVL